MRRASQPAEQPEKQLHLTQVPRRYLSVSTSGTLEPQGPCHSGVPLETFNQPLCVALRDMDRTVSPCAQNQGTDTSCPTKLASSASAKCCLLSQCVCPFNPSLGPYSIRFGKAQPTPTCLAAPTSPILPPCFLQPTPSGKKPQLPLNISP